MKIKSLFINREPLIMLILAYNVLVFFLIVFNMPLQLIELVKIKGTLPWHYVILVILPTVFLLISIIGLWFRKTWALTGLFFIYIFQSISYRDPDTKYFYFLGPRFFVELNLNLSDGTVVIGFNLLAILLIILLIIAMPMTMSKSRKR